MALRAGFHGTVGQPSAQVIDGSLKFDDGLSQYLNRTPSSSGNLTSWTFSFWIKLNKVDGQRQILSNYVDSSNDSLIKINSNGYLEIWNYRSGAYKTQYISNARFRDTSGWYNFVISCNGSTSLSVWANGVALTFSTSNGPDGTDWLFNGTNSHQIGRYNTTANSDFQLTQVNWIDGLALGPGYFGFTDPLTNTWRPKKFRAEGTTINDGTVWSNYLTTNAGDNFDASGPKIDAFDGDSSDKCYTANNSDGTTQDTSYIQFNSPVVLNGDVEIYVDNGNAVFSVDSLGGLTLLGKNSSGSDNQRVRLGYIQTSKLRVLMEGGSRPAIGAISVNGVIMQDSTTQNLDFGTNGFYLPMDGNSPIGKDQSGKGNDWTPVNFGGSVELDKATGARPILNTTQGGTQATVGVFGSRNNVGYAVTYYDDGGGNKYYIDGVKQATLTGLIRGATYTFNTVALGSTHPFRLSATSAHGTEYTNGVAAITGAATTITIPHDAPESLYYYCTAHSGMGSSITGITTNEKLADQYASNVTLALPLVGSDDDVCASIACTANNKTPTNSSVTAATTQSNFYSGSHYWSANSDTLQYAEQGNELVFGSGDYTIECWLYDDNGHNGTSNRCYIFDNRIGGSVVGDPPTMTGYIDSHNEFNFGDGTNTITHTVPSTVGKWWHYAVTREGTTTRMFIDGILRGSATSSTNFTNNGIGVGRATDANYGFAGYIQDFRVYTGVAKYTSNFVPAATNPDILPDTPSGVSGSSKLTKITDGAVSFDGTNDSLSVEDHADFTFGSGDFTMEAFVYNRSSGYRSIVMKYGGSPASSSWFWSMYNGQNQFYYYSGSNEPAVTSGKTHYNKWVHCAVSREGNTIRIFDDGELTGTLDVSSYATMNDSTVPLDIGADYADNYDMDGFISNVRIVKGTALYTSNFTPPTEPLTNVANTKLLCCQSPTNVRLSPVAPNVGITTNTRFNSNFESIPTTVNSLTVTNNGSVSTTSAGTNSYGFTNCADLSGSNSLSVNLGAIPQVTTIDIIFKVTGTSDNKYLFAISNTGLVRRTGSSLAWYNNNNDQTISTTPDDGEWHHLRVTPKSLYFDGVETQTTSTTPNIFVSANGYMALGAYRNDSGTIQYNGAVDIGLVRVMPGVDLGAPSSIPITTNGTLSSTETIPNDGVIFAAANSAATTFNPFNTDINTVRGQETGYATLNPLDPRGLSNSPTFSEGNLRISDSSSYDVVSTMGADSGRWYWEVEMIDVGSTICGIIDFDNNRSSQFSMTSPTVYYATTRSNGTREGNQSGGTNFTYTDGDTVAWALDVDNLKLYGYKNGALMSTATITQSNVKWAPYVYGESTSDHRFNFGQKPFKYAPPDGFQPLNTANTRPVKVISRPDQFVGLTTYTGSVSPQTVGGINFTSDLIWIKSRTHTGWHILQDSVRGYGKILFSNSSNAEVGNANDLISDVSSTGFSVNTNYAGGTDTATTTTSGTNSYVGWCWKAGGSKNTFNVDNVGYASAAAAGLTGGSLSLTGASVGTKQGFSIIKWTDQNGVQSLPHGLLQAPDFILIKDLGSSVNWSVYHSSMGNALAMYLNNTDAAFSTSRWDTKDPTSSIFYWSDNTSTNSQIAYCWHDVPGLQKFGSYEGNNNNDGVFVELGFRPSILLIKRVDNTDDWLLYDGTRRPINVNSRYLRPNQSNVENTGDGAGTGLDLLSNGFKIRSDSSAINAAETYIYAAWAEAPSVDLYGGGANAR